jgi:hypothetical protein
MILRDAVRIGDRLWRNHDVRIAWWEHLPTRPYMHAIRELARELADNGHYPAAIECYRDSLALCPDDPLGIGEDLKETERWAMRMADFQSEQGVDEELVPERTLRR